MESIDFPLEVAVAVRFKDIDIGGHAHHSHVLSYFEEARSELWARVSGSRDPSETRYILAEASVRWLRRIHYPQRLSVGVAVTTIGRKHFRLVYAIRDEAGIEVARGETAQVMYDYASGRTTSIPDGIRGALAGFSLPDPPIS